MSDPQTYTLRWRGRQFGPCSLLEINRRLDNYEIGMGHEILCEDKWMTLEEFFVARKQTGETATPSEPPAPVAEPPAKVITSLRLSQAAAAKATLIVPAESPAAGGNPPPEALPPPPRTPLGAAAVTRRPKLRLIYVLLGISLGFLGLHNYYARNWLTGLLQFLLSIASYLLGFGIIAPWLWAMVETVVVHQDADGIEML